MNKYERGQTYTFDKNVKCVGLTSFLFSKNLDLIIVSKFSIIYNLLLGMCGSSRADAHIK